MKNLSKRRRLEGKTNYSKRIRLLESRKPRIVIRKTNRYIIIQCAESKLAQDSVTASANSRELLDYGWPESKAGSLKSLGAAYLTGILFGKKLGNKREYIIDTGIVASTNGSRIYAAIKGLNDAGIKINADKGVLPDEKRINSENLKEFFSKVKEKIEASGGKKSKA